MPSFDMKKYFKLQQLYGQFTKDDLDPAQKVSLLQVHDYSDQDLFMSKVISADEYKQSMIRKMKDEMFSNILSKGGMDISNPFIRLHYFQDKDKMEVFTDAMPEPMQSILRLSKDSDSTVKEYGKTLLKKYQFKQLNNKDPKASILAQNMDQILLADNKKDAIKSLLKQEMLNNIQDPIDRAIVFNLQQQTVTSDKDDLRTELKDLQILKMFQTGVPKQSPVNNNDIYRFYSLATDKQISPEKILVLAVGKTFEGVSELDFEKYFGGEAKQFSCRSLSNSLRVPCGINLSGEQCIAKGCCYVPTTQNYASCYHDLYGKIGSQMMLETFVKSDSEKLNKIKELFNDNELPSLTSLLKTDLQDKVNQPIFKSPHNVQYANDFSDNWWNTAKVKGQDGKELYITKQVQKFIPYGSGNYTWKPHSEPGGTQTPMLAKNMPHPTNAPGSEMNSYYQMWLKYNDANSQAECALIPENARELCMYNYDALKNYALSGKSSDSTSCVANGCCFNEDAFLLGKPACYRSISYGTCTALPSSFMKRECGKEGVSENECLSNPRCCYKPSSKAEPWCFYKYSATVKEDEWCDAWTLLENQDKDRTPCFDPKSTKSFADGSGMKNINNLVTKDQCLAEGCCYDKDMTKKAQEWFLNGLGRTSTAYRCFKKLNPATFNSNGFNNVKIDPNMDGDNNPLPKPNTYNKAQVTCDQTKWSNPKAFKTPCTEKDVSYYQCIYVHKCCHQSTLVNEPACFQPQEVA